MPDQKFFVLQGDLAHNEPGGYLASLFNQYIISTVTQKIACLNDKSKWGNPDILVLDHRNLLFNEEAFREYMEDVALLGKTVRFADFQARPDTDLLEIQIRRTKIAREILGEGELLSPSIGVFSEDVSNLYLQYFRECGKCFSGLSVDCSIAGRDRDVATLSGLLRQAISLGPKAVFITKWCIPAFDVEIPRTRLGESALIIQRTKVAAARMQAVFRVLNTAAPNSVWYLAGAGKDYYNPGANPRDFVDKWPYASKNGWSDQNFMGLLNWDGTPKFHIAQALVEILDGRVH